MRVKITSDSTCDLTPELLRRFDISVCPLYIVKDGVSYRDNVDITPADIFAHVEAGGSLCTTAAVSEADYEEFFTREMAGYDGLVHVTISSEMSVCYQNACNAARRMNNVHVVDSRNLSSAQGLIVMEGAEIGKNTKICACSYVGQFVKIGENTMLHPGVRVMHRCIIGNRVIIHGGAVIGADGFGYNATFRGLVKVPQNGIVRIDDDVEVGACSTIDRARFGVTWIKKGVKIDNLVFVAHNVIVGESSVLIGQSGVAGSAELGRGVVLQARAGVNGHITMGDGSKVLGCSAAQKSTPPGGTVFGVPGETQEAYLERFALPIRMRKVLARLDKLEAKLAELEGKTPGGNE